LATAQLSEPIQFGKYTLFELIGRGGMAEVYKARIQGPAGFERTFVVKRILPHLSSDPTFIKMFVEEAKLSARLAHPNIVHIFELGAVEGEYFISMEYIRGHDLSETMRAIWKTMGPPRPELVAYIGREACRGLAYAHALTDESGRPLGMVHRDVSPSNVMLSYEGAVKLLDFGIAKALGDAGPETTKAGTMKGKYAYMAPEQTDGENVDNRSDIFACGIVLHEVLTGRRLFKGANDVQTIERVRQCEVPRPSLQNSAVSPALDAIVLKALAHNPADRWGDAAEMADALDDIVHAARFQPTHLAQLLYDLFPKQAGGARPTSPHATLHGHTVTGSALRSASSSVAPTSYTSSGAGPAPVDPSGSLKPRSRFRGVLLTLVLLGGAAAAGWKVYGHKLGLGSSVTVTSAPTRRFFVYIKSEPEGANIYRIDNNTLMGATPVTLPIELVGTSSMRIRLEKAGFDPFEQTITGSDPISISLAPTGGVPAAAADAGVAPPAPKPRHHHHAAPSSSSSSSSETKPDKGDDDDSPPPSDLAPDPD
jgi:serine/threonine protein kinase